MAEALGRVTEHRASGKDLDSADGQLLAYLESSFEAARGLGGDNAVIAAADAAAVAATLVTAFAGEPD